MKQRLNEFIDYKGYSIREFERKISTSNGTISRYLSKDTDIQAGILMKIHDIFPEINLDWLITGRGSMLISQKTEPEKPQPAAPDLHLNAEIDKLKAILSEKDARISDLQERIESQRHFLDMLSDSHRDLVDRSEKMLEENNQLLHSGNEMIRKISIGFRSDHTLPEPSPTQGRIAALATDDHH